jgi:hypothetical protein
LHTNNLFFFVASKAMKEDELHMYDFMGDNGDEDGRIVLASEYMFQFGEIIVEDIVLSRIQLGDLRKN